MPSEPPPALTLPLAGWAERQLGAIDRLAGGLRGAPLSGAALIGERAALAGLAVPGLVSAGGGCRLYPAADGWVALNLARRDDRALLPALFADGALDFDDDGQIACRIGGQEAAVLVARGREMGLAIASLHETPVSPAWVRTSLGQLAAGPTRPPPGGAPRVIELAALWAGPLAGRLLRLAGARVVKIESAARPDAMRGGDPRLFARLNGGKDSVVADLRDAIDRQRLVALLRQADIVIEAARPRALQHLGIDADALVRETPGLVWVTITGHGVAGEAADWVGFGDDCGVAGGLSAALLNASGKVGFVGDAIADPLTGIAAARLALAQRRSGQGARLVLAMSAVTATALAWEKRRDRKALSNTLRNWAKARGQPFPPVPLVRKEDAVHPLGSDTAAWLEHTRC